MKTKHAIRGLYGLAALAVTAVSLPALAINFTATPGGSFTAATAAGNPAQFLKLGYLSTPFKCDVIMQGYSPSSVSSNGIHFLAFTNAVFFAASPGTDSYFCPTMRFRQPGMSGGVVPISFAVPLYGNLTSHNSGITNGYLANVYLSSAGLSACGFNDINFHYSNSTNILTLLHPWNLPRDCFSVVNIDLVVTPSQTITSP